MNTKRLIAATAGAGIGWGLSYLSRCAGGV
jgi:hypothetical protein